MKMLSMSSAVAPTLRAPARSSASNGQCEVFAGDHYVRLTIDSKTWKVDRSRICP